MCTFEARSWAQGNPRRKELEWTVQHCILGRKQWSPCPHRAAVLAGSRQETGPYQMTTHRQQKPGRRWGGWRASLGQVVREGLSEAVTGRTNPSRHQPRAGRPRREQHVQGLVTGWEGRMPPRWEAACERAGEGDPQGSSEQGHGRTDLPHRFW